MSQSLIREVDNLAISSVTVAMGFIATNWLQIGLFIFAAVHAYIAIDKWRYEKKLRAKIPDSNAQTNNIN